MKSPHHGRGTGGYADSLAHAYGLNKQEAPRLREALQRGYLQYPEPVNASRHNLESAFFVHCKQQGWVCIIITTHPYREARHASLKLDLRSSPLQHRVTDREFCELHYLLRRFAGGAGKGERLPAKFVADYYSFAERIRPELILDLLGALKGFLGRLEDA